MIRRASVCVALTLSLPLLLLPPAGCGDDGDAPRSDGPAIQQDGGKLDGSGPGQEAGGGDGPVTQQDGATPGGCLKECTDFYDYLCVKDPSGVCKACLEDKHCTINPRSDGPFCDKAGKLCVCKVEADCQGQTTGTKCLKVGNYMMCACNTDADCPAIYTICEGTVIKKCVKPCTSNADCQKGGFTGTCDTKTGKCSYI